MTELARKWHSLQSIPWQVFAKEPILQEEACRAESRPLALPDGSLGLQAFPQADGGSSLLKWWSVEELAAEALPPL